MRLVADANFLLSAMIGGRARLVLTHVDLVEVLTMVAALDEIHEYAKPLARKLRAALARVLPVMATVAVTVMECDEYTASLPRLSGGSNAGLPRPGRYRHPRPCPSSRAPVWSNDRDFEAAGVEWYTSARLLTTLELGRG